MGIEAGLQGPPGGGHQYPALGSEPGQGLRGVTDMLRLRARLERRQRDRPAGGMQLQCGRVSRVQVMIEHPAGGRTPLSLAVGRLRQLSGVGAEQVVAEEPAGSMLGQQVCPGQLAESAASLVQRQAGRAGCGSGADVRAGPGEGWLELKLKLPAPLARLAYRPHRRYRLWCPVGVRYRG